jgi:hypothetical protein
MHHLGSFDGLHRNQSWQGLGVCTIPLYQDARYVLMPKYYSFVPN